MMLLQKKKSFINNNEFDNKKKEIQRIVPNSSKYFVCSISVLHNMFDCVSEHCPFKLQSVPNCTNAACVLFAFHEYL